MKNLNKKRKGTIKISLTQLSSDKHIKQQRRTGIEKDKKENNWKGIQAIDESRN